MADPEEQRFLFHGSTVALGGRITRPFSENLEVQAATSLPSIGGYASARAGRFRYRELVSFEGASSLVTGSSREGVHETLITSTVEGLNIMDVITADRVVGRLTSVATEDGAISLSPIGSAFVNLRIAGVPVSPEPHQVLLHSGKFSELEQQYQATESPFVDRHGKAFLFSEQRRRESSLAEARPGARLRRFEDCHLVTSIFQNLAVDGAPFEVTPGGALVIPGFGRVLLGQYVITRDSRRLTMLLCQLGSPVAGTLSIVEPGGNGSPP
jgi:hypothetical protein